MVMKKAFTMIELIMVIIVLGIVASIGADIIVRLYDNYIRTRTINALETKTEVALEQIAKRFQYRIKDSTIARRFNDATGLADDILPISSANLDNTYKIIEWIGYSNESFLGTPRPGWSGLIDMYNPNTSNVGAITLQTSDSNLTSAQNIMNVLTRGDVNLTANHEAALIFKRHWNMQDFGWEDNNINHDDIATLKVIRNADDIFQTSNELNLTAEIYEQYYLAASAYALVPDNGVAANARDFNLTLYYNYAPWLGQNYTNGNSSVLVEHVNLFHFRQDQTLLRFKLCIHDANQTGFGERIVVCKEKVVY